MAEKWFSENLLSIDEKVRVERGPQIVEITPGDPRAHHSYSKGALDSHGEVIGSKPTMNVVDWKGKVEPLLWKVYVFTEAEETDRHGKTEPVFRWRKVAEYEDKAEAVARAKDERKNL